MNQLHPSVLLMLDLLYDDLVVYPWHLLHMNMTALTATRDAKNSCQTPARWCRDPQQIDYRQIEFSRGQFADGSALAQLAQHAQFGLSLASNGS